MSEKEKEIIELSEAERIAEREVKKRAQDEVKKIIKENSQLEEKGQLPIYKIEGRAKVKTGENSSLLGPNEDITEERYFTAQIHAYSAKIVGMTWG